MPQINIAGTDYPLSTKLRVAYKLQEVNQRKPYMAIFEGITDMPLEKHIQFLWISFNLANPSAPSLVVPERAMSETEFKEYCLDELGIDAIMELMLEIMDGIMYRGQPPEKVEAKKAERSRAAEEKMD